MAYLKPVVETYLQDTKFDAQLGSVPTSDEYFLGRLSVKGFRIEETSYLDTARPERRISAGLTSFSRPRYAGVKFARMILPDPTSLDRHHYTFSFVRWEMLGDVRCLLVDVVPVPHSGDERFLGRIWVEDQDSHIVRFNGTFTPSPRDPVGAHFDSWRLNLLPNVWLPAFVYSEESAPPKHVARSYKAQTRIWGYDLHDAGNLRKYAQPIVDAVPESVRNKNDSGYDLNPGLSSHKDQYSGDDNVVERLQIAGLIAPAGDVDHVLETVVRNIVITNDLEIRPEVRCRVLLTTPLESFSVGRTIIVSRGLLDVLPDEGTLAMILAHELAHIILGHALEGNYSTLASELFPNEKTLHKLDSHLDPVKEEAADRKTMEIFAKSPYKDKIAQAGLFLKAVQERFAQLPHLIHPHLGHGLMMADLTYSAPQLEMTRTDQIAALPLGSRIKFDPLSDRIQLAQKTSVQANYAYEKMPFEVTPFYPHLNRILVTPGRETDAPVNRSAPATSVVPTAIAQDGKVPTAPAVSAHQESARTAAKPGSHNSSTVSQKGSNARSEGTVSITSTPEGADIFIDSVGRGSTPALLKLAPGKHSVQLALSGYKDWVSNVEVNAGSDINITGALQK
jgi:hypothetical protein